MNLGYLNLFYCKALDCLLIYQAALFMKTFSLPFEEKFHFSSKDIRYINEDPELREFYKYQPNIQSFKQAIQDKSKEFTTSQRVLLHSVLQQQYQNLPEDNSVAEQLKKLKEDKTFTITTAHQPCLLTGPLYVIYKIVSTITLAEKLNKHYPDHHFIPVFISGGEDHDFEEINHFHLFGNKIEWKTDQSGPVGRMNTDGLHKVLESVVEMSGNSQHASALNDLLKESLESSKNYGEFFRTILAKLFHNRGLVILNMDEKVLKKEAIHIFSKELTGHHSQQLVSQTQEKLERIGFSQQAFAREINLFYFHDNQRLRIEKIDKNYHLVDTEINFSEEEILNILNQYPERISPNVVLRPLYQELLLPNLAYVGGGGEIAYWLERKSQFEHYGINFPILMRRNSVFWMDHICSKNLKQIGYKHAEIFEELDPLLNRYVLEEAEDEISLLDEKKQLSAIFKQITLKAEKLDHSILKTINAEEAKHQKSLDHLEHKLLKAKKQQLEISLNKIRKVHEKVFPSSKPQERHDNFIMYYLRLGPNFIDVLTNNLDPFSNKITVFQEED